MAQLTLGPVIFQPLECPDELTVGGTQALAVHDYQGGARVVQPMGARETDITWDGILRFSGAIARATQLDQLRISGAQVQLAFTSWLYDVVVHEFKAKISHEFLIYYTIGLTVVRNRASWAQTAAAASSAAQIGAAQNLAGGQYSKILAVDPTSVAIIKAPNDALNAAVVTAQQGPGGAANPANAAAIQQATQVAVNAATTYLAGQKTPSNTVVAAVSGYIAALQTLAKNTQQPVSPLVLSVNGASLPKLAAQHYGDASLWPAIAAANGLSLSNPNVPSGVTTQIAIPPKSSVSA